MEKPCHKVPKTKQPVNPYFNLNFNLLFTYGFPSNLQLGNPNSCRASHCTINSLFTQLVNLCTLPCDIDIMDLSQEFKLSARVLSIYVATLKAFWSLNSPHSHNSKPALNIFPYYDNYVLLANLEHKILVDNGVVHPNKVAFVGSGPMPLTSFILATYHMKSTHFDNFDIDEKANDVAQKIVFTDVELSKRMKFETNDIMKVREKLAEYECIFLAALVGMNKENKEVYEGWKLVEEHDLPGFELLTIFHPNNEVINSVVLSLIDLYGRADGLLELQFSKFLPLNNLNLFPYYGNYVLLANLKHKIFVDNRVVHPKKVAFAGSEPMPLTSFILATQHMKSTHFDNFDIDEKANDEGQKLLLWTLSYQRR
ncbi:hypothetical protein DVH24_002344 [Malus domestica]|uniref:Nicotianamine synthase n=1 Tax=Malus domestica TaxID=3750 RepID=A0A498I5P2_MALDO|nr:hypothetical protein DVH24_002344 [Malus domestica]